MRLPTLKNTLGSRGFVLISAALLLLMGGCPVNTDKLTTDVVEAALQSMATSLVDTLSVFLAGN